MSLHGEKLRTDLRVINTGDAAFDFTAALHSYFEVLDISKAKVNGLAGLTYLDKVRAPPAPLTAPDALSPSSLGNRPRTIRCPILPQPWKPSHPPHA